MQIKIGCISDTHTFHEQWHNNLMYDQWGWEVHKRWDDCDIILHAGDVSSRGYRGEVQSFLKWFNSLPHLHKVFIAGNHDFYFDKHCNSQENLEEDIKNLLAQYPNVSYLNETSIELYGLKIYGTPIQPWFHNWAFNRIKGDDIKRHWELIPDDTDILIVHGPPNKILDRLHPMFMRSNEDPNVGCEILREKIFDIKPKLVVCGHIHEAYGSVEIDGITFVNASCLNENYRPVNKPQIVTIEI